MDFYLPQGNMALFVDGRVWHADPRLYEPNDILFFGSKTSCRGWKNVTAADVWRKDRTHNDYLKSKGYIIVRFWKKEIKCDIDRCIEIVKKRIHVLKKRKETNQIKS